MNIAIGYGDTDLFGSASVCVQVSGSGLWSNMVVHIVWTSFSKETYLCKLLRFLRSEVVSWMKD